jgi:hypothetical protein
MKLACCVCAMVLLLVAPGHAESDRPILGAIIMAHGLDLVSTAVATHAGAREGNPLMAEPARAIALKAGACALQLAIVHHLWTSGHRRAAIVAGISITGAYGYIGARNALIAGGR